MVGPGVDRVGAVEQRKLGSQGLEVSALGLGCMGMSQAYGPADEDESVATLGRALELGVTFFDTANAYGRGHNEILVGRVLARRRDEAVVATKFGMDTRGANGPDWGARGSRRYIHRAVEASLRRLGTDHIDLYQMHRYDPSVDLDETLGALTDLVRAGKVRYIGHSTFPASALLDAQYVARDRGRERFVTEQPTYSILTRNIENEILPLTQRYGMGVLSYSPLAGGWLSGRYRRALRGRPATCPVSDERGGR